MQLEPLVIGPTGSDRATGRVRASLVLLEVWGITGSLGSDGNPGPDGRISITFLGFSRLKSVGPRL